MVWLGKDLRDHFVLHRCHGGHTFHSIRVLGALFNPGLNTGRDGAAPAVLGSLFRPRFLLCCPVQDL